MSSKVIDKVDELENDLIKSRIIRNNALFKLEKSMDETFYKFTKCFNKLKREKDILKKENDILKSKLNNINIAFSYGLIEDARIFAKFNEPNYVAEEIYSTIGRF